MISMPELETRRPVKRRPVRQSRFHWAIAAGAAVVLCIAVVAFLFLSGILRRYDPPIIQGVQEQVSVYEDDDIQTALLEGVTAVGGEDRPDATFPVTVTAYQESGEAVQEFLPGTYRLEYTSEEGAQPVEATLVVQPADREPPVITGAQDVTVVVGSTLSYRSGVTVEDNVDPAVTLQVDASQVNLSAPGAYPVTYSAVDSRGNEAAVTVTVTVVEPEEAENLEDIIQQAGNTALSDVTDTDVYALADRILASITSAGMGQREKARAIFDYVHGAIRYVGTSEKNDWLMGAYVGLTQGRGDCFNYFAASKLLLTRAGIPNIDLERVGGNTDHYWQLVNVGDGYYHFDTCPHPNEYPITCFLLTEAEVRDYTERCASVRKNYYVYDYAACPVTVVGTPAEETAEPSPEPSPEPSVPAETPSSPAPETPPVPETSPVPETTPAPETTPVPETTPIPAEESPAPPAETVPPESAAVPQETPVPTQDQPPEGIPLLGE